mgnify:FL=1
MQFDYVMIVASIKEAEYEARKLGLSRNDFRYCTKEQDVAGRRLPSDKLLFISEKMDNEMAYLDNEGNLHWRLEDRFHTIVDIYGRILTTKRGNKWI